MQEENQIGYKLCDDLRQKRSSRHPGKSPQINPNAPPRTFTNASTRLIVETVGWTEFYLLCVLLALPRMLLLWVAPWGADS